jgi:hypothetical protein
LVERKKGVVDAAAGLDAERFAVVSEIEIAPPAAAYVGAVSDETRRSGPMRIARARVLLPSLLSKTWLRSSALATMK